MGSYQVVVPCSFMSGSKVVHAVRPGAVVEVSDSEAKALVAAGKLEPKESKAKSKDES